MWKCPKIIWYLGVEIILTVDVAKEVPIRFVAISVPLFLPISGRREVMYV